ncbi:hypothetical protein [Nocardia sp. NPDC004711]
MTDELDPAEDLIHTLATVAAATADMTVCWRRAAHRELIEPEHNRDHSDGVLSGLWLALLTLVVLGPGTDIDKGRHLLRVEQRLPEHLRALTHDSDDLTGPVEDLPDDLAIDAYCDAVHYLRKTTTATRKQWDLCKQLLDQAIVAVTPCDPSLN